MRDAFGGALMIQLLLIFLTLYISFMAIALSYSKAFRVKNEIINYIEQYEGYNDRSKELIDAYLEKQRYYVEVKDTSEGDFSNYVNNPNQLSPGATYCANRGYCITEQSQGNRGTYYIVETYLQIKFPFFNLDFTVPIKGETRIITANK